MDLLELRTEWGLNETGPKIRRLVRLRQKAAVDCLRGSISLGRFIGDVAEWVGIGVGVVSGVMNLESSGVEASDWRPRHEERYHAA